MYAHRAPQTRYTHFRYVYEHGGVYLIDPPEGFHRERNKYERPIKTLAEVLSNKEDYSNSGQHTSVVSVA